LCGFCGYCGTTPTSPGDPVTVSQPSAPYRPTPPRVLLTIEAAAAQLSIGRTTMYALLKTGAITSVRIGRLRRIPAEALTAYTAHLVAEQNAA
jgi:excisionase family DNA binding protein